MLQIRCFFNFEFFKGGILVKTVDVKSKNTVYIVSISKAPSMLLFSVESTNSVCKALNYV